MVHVPHYREEYRGVLSKLFLISLFFFFPLEKGKKFVGKALTGTLTGSSGGYIGNNNP